MLAFGALASAQNRLTAFPRSAYATFATLALVVAVSTAVPLMLPRAPHGFPSFWLANALLLVAVLRARPESRNAFLLVGLLANVAARLVVGEPLSGCAANAFSNVLEVAGASAFIRWRRGVNGSGRGGNKLVEITFWSAVVAPTIGATLTTVFVALTAPGHAVQQWLTVYLRDGFGMVAIVPFGIALEFEKVFALFRRRALVQTLLILGALVGVDSIVFLADIFPRLFIIFPLFVFVAFRLGVAGAAFSIALTTAIAAVTTTSGHGPLMLPGSSPFERLFGLQLFLAVGAWTMLPICEVLRDREALLAQLHERWTALAESHSVLEERNARVEELIALSESVAAALPSRNAVIDVVLRFVQQQTDAVGAVMERVSGDNLVYEVATGILAGAVGASVKRAGSLSGLCSSSNEALSCIDAELDERVDRAACRLFNIRSMIVVPIAIDGAVVGVLKVASDRPKGFGQHDILNLKLAVRHLSSAMRAASSYEFMRLAEAEAQATIENMTDGVAVFASDGELLRHNKASERILNLSKDELERWFTGTGHVVDVNDRPLAAQDRSLAVALRTGEAQRDVVFGIGSAGVDRRWLSINVVPVSFAGGTKPDRFVLCVRDVTELQQSELAHRGDARRLRALNLIGSQVSHTGREQINAALALCCEELGLEWGYLGVFDEAAAEFVMESTVGLEGEPGPQAIGNRLPVERTLIGRVLGSAEVLTILDLAPVLEADSSLIVNGLWGAYIAVPIVVDGRVYGAIGFVGRSARTSEFPATDLDFVRITSDLVGSAIERRLQRERLDALAFSDALTGLPNRLVFEDRLAQTILAAKRYREQFAVFFIDLDGFKAINDTYGHGAGDKLLQAVAQRLETVVRNSDTVARIGGDEFLILAPKVGSWSDARDLAWRVVLTMREPILIDGVACAVSASVGASVYPEDGEDAATIIKRADAALYRAKSTGKNSVGFARELTLRP